MGRLSVAHQRGRLMKLRGLGRSFIQFKVGDGNSIFFMWLDCWHPGGVLYSIYGYRAVYDVGSSEGNWKWPPARSDDVVEIGIDDK